MFIPISHEQSTVRRLPWVTFGLMGTCLLLLVFSAHVADTDRVYQGWGLVPKHTNPVTLFTHMFLHAGWIHLLGNMLILFLAGAPLEDRWGRPLFAGFYVLAGLAAGLFYVLMTPGSAIPMVGASGAIAALMGACMVRFWRSRIQFLWFWVFGFPLRVFHGTFWAPVWLMLPLWFASEVFMAALADHMDVTTGVAYWAHVGGFAFGVGIAWAMNRWQIEERFIDAFIEKKVTVVENPLLDRAMQARMEGDPDGAWAMLKESVEEEPGNPDFVGAYWELACEMGRAERAAPAVLKLVRVELSEGDAQLAAQYWCEVAERAPEVRADPALLVRLHPILLAREQNRQAATALRHTVLGQTQPLTPGQALRVVELARDRDPQTALAAARIALAAPDLHEAKRAKLAALVAELEKQGAEPVPEPPVETKREEGTDPRFAQHSLPVDLEEPPPLPAETPQPAAPLELDPSGGLVTGADRPDLGPAEVEMPPIPSFDPDADLDDAVAFAAASVARFSGVKALDGAPVEIGERALSVARNGGARGNLPYEKIEAIAVAAVKGLSAKPVLLVDLVLNWSQTGEGPIQLMRLRSDRFDVRKLVPEATRPTEAFRSLVQQLLERTGATPLPSLEAAAGRPFARYDDLDAYQREVLCVE